MALPATAADYLALDHDHDQQADVLLQGWPPARRTSAAATSCISRFQPWFPQLNGLAPQPAGGFAVMQAERNAVTEALEDAYAALESNAEIRPDPSAGNTFCQVTRKGQAWLEAATMPDARRVTFARRVLEHVNLHRVLQAHGIDSLFRHGMYETALRDGSTYLEDAIRTLGGFTTADVGT